MSLESLAVLVWAMQASLDVLIYAMAFVLGVCVRRRYEAMFTA